jgi:hypothetical protein
MSIAISVYKQYDNRAEMFLTGTNPATKVVKIYVALIDADVNYHLVGNVPPEDGSDNRFSISDAEVQAADATLASASFSSTCLFFRAVADSDAISTGITKQTGVFNVSRSAMGENPMSISYLYGLSQQGKGQVPISSTRQGSISISSIPFYEDEYVIDKTYDGSGKVATELYYLKNDPTGSRALLITYTNGANGPTKIEYTNTTKP